MYREISIDKPSQARQNLGTKARVIKTRDSKVDERWSGKSENRKVMRTRE